jgi:hypothetical protein
VIRNQFALNWRGLHGAPHWARVRQNGLRLAARLVEAWRGSMFELGPDELNDLVIACKGHSDGLREGNPTVLTC